MDSTKQSSNNFSLEDVIGASIKLPLVKVDRDKFLEAQFAGSEISVDEILTLGPVEAGVSRETISQMANKLIIKRTSQSSVASFVAGIPGGIAMAATVPGDLMQFFGMALRLAQELSYLYGAQNLWADGKVDDEKIKSQLIMYCGVMFGASGAVSGVRVLSTQIAKTTLKRMPQKALMKTVWYPMVKQIGKFIGVNITKTTVAKGVSKAIPVIGGVISGGINFASMVPMAKRLCATFDKAAFDYSDADYENDLDVMEKIAKGEVIIDAEPSKADEIKEKISGKIKNVGDGVSGLIGKFGKKAPEQSNENPIEQVKALKELLDIGAITQEEFDLKKKELLKL